jgi:hypothetical protein
MAQETEIFNEKEMHFKATYRYILFVTVVVLGYVIAVTFLPIPSNNTRFIDVAFGFLLKFLGDSSGWLIGGNPATQSKKTDGGDPTVTRIITEPPPDDTPQDVPTSHQVLRKQ